MLPKRRHSIQTVPPAKIQTGDEDQITDEEQIQLQKQINKGTRRQSIAESIQLMTKSVSNVAESIKKAMTKSRSPSFQKAMHLGSNHGSQLFDDKNKLNKAFLKEVLSQYFNQSDLKITKLNVKPLIESDCVQHYPTSTVTDLLMNLENKQGGNTTSCNAPIKSSTTTTTLTPPMSPPAKDPSGDLVDLDSLFYKTMYELEVWIKYNSNKGTVRRKLDLVAKCHPKKESVMETKKQPGITSQHLEAILASEGRQEDVEEEGMEDNETGTLHEKALTASQERLFEADRDYKAHTTIVNDLCSFLRKKSVVHPEEYLSLPMRFQTEHVTRSIPLSNVNESSAAMLEDGGIEADLESFYKHLFLIQDLYASGYRMADVGPDENGLDFTHSLLATAKLASFHAVSYCMRKEENADFLIRYPFLNEDPVYRPATKELFTQAQNSLTKKMHNIFLQQNESQIGVDLPSEQGQYFQEAVSNLFNYQARFVDPHSTDDKFNVLCHGDLWMQNVVFSYGSCLESQSDVVDVRFDDLHHARYASCATDIHNLLYYTVDADIRRDHTVNLLAVYHDHFAKTVKSLSPGLSVFTQSELLMEFHRVLKFGFLEGITLFSTAYETQLRKKKAEEKITGQVNNPQDSTWSGSSVKISGPRYTDYRDTVLSLMADVSRLKFQGVIPGAPTGGQSPNVEKSNSQCGSAKKDPLQSTEKVLVTPL